ncbi:MAG: peptidoglycan-binding protein [Paracoccus sp. (in: a-proteobacteria)]|uniref:peptidoglycan-binding protein n=1 Tax=Paracoccus sp. TaxID=267 RepID=UPI0039E30B4A
MRHALILLVALMGAAPAWAESRAVIIGNADYRNAPDLGGADMAALVRTMRNAGFQVAEGIDQTVEQMRATLELVARADARPGARIVSLSGRFVSSPAETWFLGVEAGQPGPETVRQQGLPITMVLQLIGRAGPGGVLLLGTDQQDMPRLSGLQSGIGDLDPGRVSVVIGQPEATARALRELSAGRSLGQALTAGGGNLRLLPGGDPALIPARPGPRPQVSDTAPADEDRASWLEAFAQDSVGGYDNYLRRHPLGGYAGAATERRRALLGETQSQGKAADRPEAVEAALSLGQPQRLAVQRSLSRLGFDTGPVDGNFGPRSREAIRAWQQRSGLGPTGYLTRTQNQMLNRQVGQLDRADRDRAFWRQTGAKGGVAGLKAYLTRYPNGLFSDEALRHLSRQGADPSPESEAATWAWAQGQASAAGYDAYLDHFPQGAYAAQARQMRDALTVSAAAAQQAETALKLDPATRRRIEERLLRAGFSPGIADGEFTAETRQALRRYQASRNLTVSGYVSSQTAASLLAERLP